jgi:DNA (cytosine-5)-methyltransferase 1
MKVFTAFSGYDSQCMALDRLGIDYELIAWSEIDKYAIQAHNAVYPQYADRNYGDICKIDWIKVPDFDLFTYSFPCQDISNAGLQRGLKEGSGTRSGLLWECRKAIEIKRPKYLLMENVKALTSEKFLPYLQKWLLFLESMGYSNFTKVLNSKDYGVPQNRERVFVVSIFGDERYYFPKAFKLEKRLKDVLENNVDESYYLSNKMTEDLTLQHKETDVGIIYEGDVNKGGQKGVILSQIGICTALTATDYKQPKQIIQFKSCAMRGRNPDNPSDRRSGIPTEQRIEIGGDIANCLTTVQKDSLVLEPSTDSSKTEYSGVIGISVHPNSHKMEFKGESSVKGICPALRATDYKCPHTVWLSNKQVEYKGGKLQEGDSLYLDTSKDFSMEALKNISRTLKAEKHDAGVVQNYRIRKLTPRECFRLMGVSEENIDKIQNAGISKTQQYKMAGNSIVVDVLYYIFKKLFIDKKANKGDEQILF